MRIGIGYDVHKLTFGCPLIIGGVKIPYHLGLLGHSDADVLIHAIMDGIVGALGKGDIGKLFPDTDEEYKGISSMILLERVGQLMEHEGYRLVNIDSIIIAEKPKMAPYIEKMKANISQILKLADDCINIKATTEEGLGFTGRGEGIAAQAVILVQ